MRTYRAGLLLLAAAIALAGCSGATAKAEPDATPMEPPAPLLLGIWQVTETAQGEAGEITTVHTLTFRPERWIWVFVVRDQAGARVDHGHEQGGWEQTDTTITKLYLPWDIEANAPATEAVRVAKQYTLTADTLVVQWWQDDKADTGNATMTRVTDPSFVTTLAGSSWVSEWLNPDTGKLEQWTLVFTDAGWRYTFDWDLDAPDEFSMGGLTWTEDTENGATLGIVDAVSRADLTGWIGDTVRFSYAPSGGKADVLHVSLWFNDQAFTGEGEAQDWNMDPHPVWKYGNYGWTFTRADP